ncbi:uncharacterized protein AMSG_12083 [Thecamonas trahens ATCC 50062]|uniref:UBR-type domain-containing protein n=1 Tax=Thecamonas trahens ATCC 50062 TaxID=461836 RepID=A0A0L0DJC0_THETB|nr:hypothetical protein AMSG_12083 [Thecamonas trahens ATCC 50062]KNC51423.1 hypothetical protein AMSG_12083 [Thecamonas trahens ATCC 50062]|eukprot:XP_013756163.1 hypothetical protein AMSG_12083 [Thecamonas trahens ATCC 50062]
MADYPGAPGSSAAAAGGASPAGASSPSPQQPSQRPDIGGSNPYAQPIPGAGPRGAEPPPSYGGRGNGASTSSSTRGGGGTGNMMAAGAAGGAAAALITDPNVQRGVASAGQAAYGAAGHVGSGAVSAGQAAYDGAGDAVNYIGANAGPGAQQVGSAIQQGAGAAYDGAGDAVNYIGANAGPGAQQVGSAVRQGAGAAYDGAGDAINYIGANAGPGAQQVGSAVRQGAGAAYDGAGDAINYIGANAGPGVDQIGSVVGQGAGAAYDGAGDAINYIGANAGPGVDQIGSVVGQGASVAFNEISGVVSSSGVTGVVSSAGGFISDALSSNMMDNAGDLISGALGKMFGYFYCHTCNLTPPHAICAACASSCHASHDVRPSSRGSKRFYCDCGAANPACSLYSGPKRGTSLPANASPRARHIHLARGCDALLLRDIDAPSAAAVLALGPGAGLAAQHAPHVARLGAHMLADAVSAFERIAALEGVLSVSVAVDHTYYAVNVPHGALSAALAVLADIAAPLSADDLSLPLAHYEEIDAPVHVSLGAAATADPRFPLDAVVDALSSTLSNWLARAATCPLSLTILSRSRLNTAQAQLYARFASLAARVDHDTALHHFASALPHLPSPSAHALFVDPAGPPAVHFCFPLLAPHTDGTRGSLAHDMILHAINHSGPGSLAAYLRAHGLASRVVASLRTQIPLAHLCGRAVLAVSITPAADPPNSPDSLAAIGSALFTYLGMLEAVGPLRWMWCELRDAAARDDAAYLDPPPSPLDTAVRIAVAAFHLPRPALAHVLTHSPHALHFEPALVSALLAACTPGNLVLASNVSAAILDAQPTLARPAPLSGTRYTTDIIEPHWSVMWELARSRGSLVLAGTPYNSPSPDARAARRDVILAALDMTHPPRNLFAVTAAELEEDIIRDPLPEIMPGFPFGAAPHHSLVLAHFPRTSAYSLPRLHSLHEDRHLYLALQGAVAHSDATLPRTRLLVAVLVHAARIAIEQALASACDAGLVVNLAASDAGTDIVLHLAAPGDIVATALRRALAVLAELSLTPQSLILGLADLRADLASSPPLAASPDELTRFMLEGFLGSPRGPAAGVMDQLAIIKATLEPDGAPASGSRAPLALDDVNAFLSHTLASPARLVLFGYGFAHDVTEGLALDAAALVRAAAHGEPALPPPADPLTPRSLAFKPAAAAAALGAPAASSVVWTATSGLATNANSASSAIAAFWHLPLCGPPTADDFALLAIVAGLLDATLTARFAQPDMTELVVSHTAWPKAAPASPASHTVVGLAVMVDTRSDDPAALEYVLAAIAAALASLAARDDGVSQLSANATRSAASLALRAIPARSAHLDAWTAILEPEHATWLASLDAAAAAVMPDEATAAAEALLTTPVLAALVVPNAPPASRGPAAPHIFNPIEVAHGLKAGAPAKLLPTATPHVLRLTSIASFVELAYGTSTRVGA